MEELPDKIKDPKPCEKKTDACTQASPAGAENGIKRAERTGGIAYCGASCSSTGKDGCGAASDRITRAEQSGAKRSKDLQAEREARLAQKVRDLPRQPGVYQMLDRDGTIIYIGKAKVLKNRVSQYFYNLSSHTPKVRAMVANIRDFRYIITHSELDALTLEATLVKQHQPHYNILLKDDKAHPYIRIDLKQEFSALEITRRLRPDGAKYFGPYFGGIAVKDVIEICKSAFKVRACRGNHWNASHRVCLNYHLGLCSGACEGRVTKEEYRAQLERVMRFLNGHDDDVEQLLKERMKAAAQQTNYEQAMIYRDRLSMLDRIGARLLANLSRDANFDVFGYATNDTYAAVSVLIVRGGKTVAEDNFSITDASLSAGECLSEFLVRYYDGSRMLPPEIVVGAAEEEAFCAVREYLKTKYGQPMTLTLPKAGTKKKLVESCVTNARDFLTKTSDDTRRREDRTIGAVKKLQSILGLAHPPRRMECYDISNISGTDKVASMVVFFDGAPDKASYRRFRIKTVEGSNDFASMKETLSRRLRHLGNQDSARFGAPPDLIVVDGGKGQLTYALSALKETGYDNIPLISLAERYEEIFVPGRSDPIVLPRDSYALQLVQRIRDEAHRFAITYHRNLRANRYLSQLEEIPGIGKERRIALISRFKSVEAIRAATVEELVKTDGIGLSRAKAIRAWCDRKEAARQDPALPAGSQARGGLPASETEKPTSAAEPGDEIVIYGEDDDDG